MGVWLGVLIALTSGQPADLWSVRPLAPHGKDTPFPSIAGSERINQQISRALVSKKLVPLKAASPHDLIVRVHLDLTGLPPSANEAEAFVRNPSEKAFQEVVDRLLMSRAHAEHWARHWLDVARYADSKGYAFLEERSLPFAWTYRDWVVGALLADVPYDRFVRLQLAADLLPEAAPADKAALGFLTLGRRFLNNLPDILDDRVDVVSRGLLGFTVSCARCHDHKHDPITMRDYYGLYSVFANSPETKDLPRLTDKIPDDASRDFAKEQTRRDKLVKDFVEARMSIRRDSFRKVSEVRRYLLAAYADPGEVTQLASEGEFNPFVWQRWRDCLDEVAKTDPVMGPWKILGPTRGEEFARGVAALDLSKVNPRVAKLFVPAPADPTELASRYAGLLADPEAQKDNAIDNVLRGPKAPMNVPNDMSGKLFGRTDRDVQRELQRQADEWRAATPAVLACAMVLKDQSPPTVQKIMRRGNPNLLGDTVVPRLPEFLGGSDISPFQVGSGRADLARAITTGKARELLARVIVNRVWAWHFGEGIVRTPSDFGTRGEAPTHPDLLDQLASDFLANGMSLRWLHKTILMTDAYRRASSGPPRRDLDEADPDNRLLARQNRRRLDFESLRDRLLFATGTLSEEFGGPADALFTTPFPTRRTIYGFVDRQNLPSTWVALDGPNPDAHLPKRTTTLTPAQGLFWLNHPLVIEACRDLCARMDPNMPDANRAKLLFRSIVARDPTAAELDAMVECLSGFGENSPSKARHRFWSHGRGMEPFPDGTGRIENPVPDSFVELGCFTGESWQATPLLPRPGTGKLQLTAEGGHPGPIPEISAIRRFHVPADGEFTLIATVQHPDYRGDGIRATIVHQKKDGSAREQLWQKKVHNGIKDHKIRVQAKAGDTIDFVADCGRDPGYDSFFWSPTVQHATLGEWTATAGFTGPETAPLDRFGLLAQTLLWTTEFQWIP